MRFFNYKTIAKAVLLSTGATMAVAASAQTAVPTGEEGAGNTGLAEIIVTAQRRTETAQKAAIAITAVPSEVLSRAGVSDVTELGRLAPALQISSFGGTNTQFYLRGVGNFTANSLSDAALSVNVDGVPLANSSSIQGMFFDLERVEVLKGPQGTLYGRNATGGAVNIITAKPKLNNLEGYLNAEYGNYDAWKLAGAVNVPSGDKAALRMAVEVAKRDGFYSDGSGDDDRQSLRLQGLVQPSETLKITAGVDYSHFGGKGFGQTLYGLNRDDRIGIADPRAGAFRATFPIAISGTKLTPLPDDSFQDNRYWGAFAQADLTTSIGTFTIIPSYRNAKVKYISETVSSVHDRQDTDQFSLEARLASDNDRPLTYLLGGFYLDQHTKQKPAFTQDAFNSYADYNIKTKSYAAFGRLTYKLTDTFRLSGGMRYTVDDKAAQINAYRITLICPFGSGGCPGTPPLPMTFDIPSTFFNSSGALITRQNWGPSGAFARASYLPTPGNKTFKKLTYRVGFEYDVRPQSLLYGSFETGFKAGGFFGSVDNPAFKPETIDAFTLGSKNRFLNNRLQINAEAFWWIYKDQQVSHFRLNSLGQPEFQTENIGKARMRGFEVEVVARPATNTTLNATVQYLDAKRTDYVFRGPAANIPATGCASKTIAGTYEVNCNGTRAPNSPKWTLNGGIQQDFVMANNGKFSFNADAHYQSSYYSGVENLASELQDGYFTLNLQLKYTTPGEHFSIGAFVNNVTDNDAVLYTNPHFFVPTLLSEAIMPPRTYGVRAGFKF